MHLGIILHIYTQTEAQFHNCLHICTSFRDDNQPTSRFIRLVTEFSFELQLLSLLFIQHEAVDVGEQLLWGDRRDEALSVVAKLIQQHHVEERSGDPESLSDTDA